MDSAEKILRDLAAGNYRVEFHAKQRMSQRNISDWDIRTCGDTGIATLQSNGRYRVIGEDADGDELEIICVDDGETIIVTVY